MDNSLHITSMVCNTVLAAIVLIGAAYLAVVYSNWWLLSWLLIPVIQFRVTTTISEKQ